MYIPFNVLVFFSYVDQTQLISWLFFSFMIAKAFDAGIFSFTTKGFFVISFFKSFTLLKFLISRLKSPSVTIPSIYLFFKIIIIPSFFYSLFLMLH